MNYKILATVLIIGFAVGVIVDRKLQVPIEIIKDKIVTVTHYVKLPNGNETTDTIITEDRRSAIPVLAPRKDYFVQLSYDMQKNYSLSVSRRILGNFYVGGAATTTGVLAVNVGYEF